MSEPILSREEILDIGERFYGIGHKSVFFDVLGFASALESALLEKLRGEQIYQARQLSDEAGRWDDVYEATHSACASQPQFYETRIVYTLKGQS
ncbi:hypothetical protein [Burkholderia cepacia]|uniref:hypothetical protein n=1 Tax=Burkholderia cepacia TaxID=292 RepID=UPI000753B920|nr:hypothetical protein [Burkholderia cepacia]KWF90340.1 hypothetical protein WL95_27305 [Burkholderia cepacia]